MDKDAVPVHVEISFTEIASDPGTFIISIKQLRRSKEGRQLQSAHETFRVKSRQSPNWNGNRIAAFVDLVISQFPADAMELEGFTYGHEDKA